MTALLVVVTIVVAVAVDVLVTKFRRRRSTAPVAAHVVPMLEPRPPHGTFLGSAHSWVRIATDGSLRVGIDDFLAEALGEVDAVVPPHRGTQVDRGDALLTLHLKGRTLVLPAPAAGEVVAINEHVTAKPWLLTRDPYGVGWVVALWTRDHHEALKPLRIGGAALAFLRHEVQRLADFLTPVGAATAVPQFADGGVPRRGAVAALDHARLEAFQREFLTETGEES
jgi:glycine cleavage system H protein